MKVIFRKVVHEATGRFFEVLPLGLGGGLKLTATELSPTSETFFISKDKLRPHIQVNVFDDKGNLVYTITREHRFSAVWYIYKEPVQAEVAKVTAELLTRRVTKTGGGALRMVTKRGLRGKLHRHFYDQSGKLYEWSRRSNFLERVINPGGGYEEVRERVAFVRSLRPYWFDWELLVDTQKVGVLDALSTAFIMMNTQWLDNKVLELPVVRSANHASTTPVVDVWDHSGLLMYKPVPAKLEPRDFFNPPRVQSAPRP